MVTNQLEIKPHKTTNIYGNNREFFKYLLKKFSPYVTTRHEKKQFVERLEKHIGHEYERNYLDCGMYNLEAVLDVIGNPRGRRILEIGCGAIPSDCKDSPGSGEYDLWLCKTLYALGANIAGIDICNMGTQDFETQRLNVLNGFAPVFEPGSFDASFTSKFWHSPTLYSSSYYVHNKRECQKKVYQDIHQVLKAGGVHVDDDIENYSYGGLDLTNEDFEHMGFVVEKEYRNEVVIRKNAS